MKFRTSMIGWSGTVSCASVALLMGCSAGDGRRRGVGGAEHGRLATARPSSARSGASLARARARSCAGRWTRAPRFVRLWRVFIRRRRESQLFGDGWHQQFAGRRRRHLQLGRAGHRWRRRRRGQRLICRRWRHLGSGRGGDGQWGSFEACDDGNVQSGDGCSATCTLEVGWTCPSLGEPCHEVQCGDGSADSYFVPSGDGQPIGGATGTGGTGSSGYWVWEECDDGNVASGDGCDATCALEPGWIDI